MSLHAVYELAAAVDKHPHDLLPPPEALSPDGIQTRKLKEMELEEHNNALVKKLMERSEGLRGGMKK